MPERQVIRSQEGGDKGRVQREVVRLLVCHTDDLHHGQMLLGEEAQRKTTLELEKESIQGKCIMGEEVEWLRVKTWEVWSL